MAGSASGLSLDHKTFIGRLEREERLALLEKSDWAGVAHLLPHLGVVVVLSWLITIGAPFWWALMVPLGIALVFLFTLLHECIHRTVFKTRWANDVLAWVAGLVLVLGPSWFRYFHFAHHRHTQDPMRDPELATPKPTTRVAYWVHISGLSVWWSHLTALFSNAFGKGAFGEGEARYVPQAAEPNVRKEAYFMLAVYAILLLGSVELQSTLLLWIWIIPALLGQPFLRLYLLAEHADCEESGDMFANTRTTFTTSLIRRLAWNMPYHAEHHALPTVPFHRLPALHALVKAELKETEDGYQRFNLNYLKRVSEARSKRG